MTKGFLLTRAGGADAIPQAQARAVPLDARSMITSTAPWLVGATAAAATGWLLLRPRQDRPCRPAAVGITSWVWLLPEPVLVLTVLLPLLLVLELCRIFYRSGWEEGGDGGGGQGDWSLMRET